MNLKVKTPYAVLLVIRRWLITNIYGDIFEYD